MEEFIVVERCKKIESNSILIIYVYLGVFILLLLSGERNFGVRLNKPYTAAVPMDIPIFAGQGV